MKILVSAIACSPILGSEAYVGWSTVHALSRNHELWVIINNLEKEGTQAEVAKGEVPANIHFSSSTTGALRKNSMESWFLRGTRIGLSPDWGAGSITSIGTAGYWNRRGNSNSQVGFDLVHHVTYATWRVGSPLVYLGVPFVWGPIGSGENMPIRFMSTLSWESCVFEFIP
jgi:hypothetical protein